VRAGLLMIILGLFVLFRTVRHDHAGKTLVDHITG
jgi:hypothetical protein